MESNKTEKVPVRRVGSLTLGFGLMAVGVFFLCYYFVPQFNWELALKIAPAAGLCLLGGEVLYFAAKPEKWKYDFLSVFYCLLLMGVCLCVGALPMVLDRFGPENEMRVTHAPRTSPGSGKRRRRAWARSSSSATRARPRRADGTPTRTSRTASSNWACPPSR